MINELSIIVPTLNEEKYLPKLLDSIIAQNFSGSLEVIIADGSSTDKTLQKANAFRDKIPLTIVKTERGIGRQRNKGAEKARYKYLLFLDADVVLPSNLLNKIASSVTPQQYFVASAILMPRGGDFLDMIVFGFAYFVIAVVSLFRPVTSGAFLLTSMENYKKIGGFGEEIILGEDVDFGDRSMKQGATFYLLYYCLVPTSSRRSQRMGKIPMIITYVRMYIYYLRKGPILKRDMFEYPYGSY